MSDYPKVDKNIFNTVQNNTELFLKMVEQYFPAAIKDKQVDFYALKEEMGEFEEVGAEKYALTWSGKQNANKKSLEPVLGRTLRFCSEESKSPDTTENLYIEGDNLEILKLLRQSYYGAVKMIYIDPPYNTGNDFVYNDNFKMSKAESDEAEGDTVDGERMTKNLKGSNLYHAKWLNMLYPRLKVARDLLMDDGVVFISIDDNEVENLKKICNEVFGEENFVGIMTVQSNPRGSQASKHLSNVHEYILMFAKNSSELNLKGISKTEDNIGEYSETELDGRKYRLLGLRQRGGAWKKEDRPKMHYPIYINPISEEVSLDKSDLFYVEVIPQRPTGELSRWTWGKDKLEDEKNKVVGKRINRAGQKDAWDIFRKDYLEDENGNEKTSKIKTIWIEKETNYQNAKNEMKSLFGNSEMFDFPKPTYIVKQLASMLWFDDDDIIIDFFSGSATTAHAVMQLNAEDSGNRKFIMLQLPEETDENGEAYKAGYKNICEIGKERIRRAGDKIKEEKGLIAENLDIGFKVFKVDDTNIRWEHDSLIGENLDFAYSDMNDKDKIDFMPGFKDIDVVYEIMLRQYNIPLSTPVEKLSDIGDRTYIFADTFVVCLEESITTELIEKLAAIEPVPHKYFFRDSAFGDDIELKDVTFRRMSALVEKNCGTPDGSRKNPYTVEFI